MILKYKNTAAIECPYCSSKDISHEYKGNTINFLCRDCLKFFLKTTKVTKGKKKNSNKELANLKCEHCSSKNFKKNGVYQDGRRKFKCQECGKTFSNEPKKEVKKIEGVVCPLCSGDNILKQKDYQDGRKRFLCKDCKKAFSNEEKKEVIFDDTGFCPFCLSLKLLSKGECDNYQRVKCKDCNKIFKINLQIGTKSET